MKSQTDLRAGTFPWIDAPWRAHVLHGGAGGSNPAATDG